MSIAQKKKPTPTNAACDAGNASGLVCNYPMSSVLVVFGIGIGAGVALVSLLSGPVAQPTLARRTEMAAVQLGRQVLDAITGVLPPSLAKHISV